MILAKTLKPKYINGTIKLAKRLVRFYDLKIKAKVKCFINNEVSYINTNALPITTILGQIKKIFQDREHIVKESPDGTKYYLADIIIEDDETRATLLINKSDPNEPDQTISNPIARDRRELIKPDGFGNDYSAHVCIRINPEGHVHPMVYESPTGGIAGGRIHSFINFLLRECRHEFENDYKIPHPAGSMRNGLPVLVNALHSCDMNGKISDDFLQDLSNGSLGRIELANYSNKGEFWDQQHGFKEEKKLLVLRPQIDNIPSDGLLDAIRSTITRGHDFDYNKAVIVFKDPSDSQRTVEMNTEDFTLSDNEKYVKKAHINTPGINHNGYGGIDDGIKQALYAFL